MTLQEVTDVASVLIGKSVDTALANRFLNEGLRLLIARYPTACPIKCLRVLWQADTDPYPMPPHRGIYKIYRNKQLYGDYRLDEEGLYLNREGEYQVFYYSAPQGLVAEGEPIPSAPEYDSELCKYVAFSVLRADDPSNRLADRLIEEFYDNCAAIHKSLQGRLRKPSAPLPTPTWR